MSPGWESNPRVSVLQTDALTTSPPGLLYATLYHLKLTNPSKYDMISANAGMMELVDMQHLNCCEATRAGSSPAPGTI